MYKHIPTYINIHVQTYVQTYTNIYQHICTNQVLCANHTRAHYEVVLRKQGIDVGSLEKAGRLVFLCVDLSAGGEPWAEVAVPFLRAISSSSSGGSDSGAGGGGGGGSGSRDGGGGGGSSSSGATKHCLVVDDLDMLEVVSISSSHCTAQDTAQDTRNPTRNPTPTPSLSAYSYISEAADLLNDGLLHCLLAFGRLQGRPKGVAISDQVSKFYSLRPGAGDGAGEEGGAGGPASLTEYCRCRYICIC
jgi:hypothetical protein